MKVPLTLPPLAPDINEGAILEVAENVYPKVDGYGPVNSPVDWSTALPAAFAGGASFIDNLGTVHLIAGTTNGLELYNAGMWDNLITGMSVTRWRFAQFGDYAIGVNGVSTKVVDLQASTGSTLTGAPAANFITVVGDYVVVANVGTDERLNVYNSSFNDHTGWTPGDRGSGIQPMLTGGEIMGLAGGEYGIILQRSRLVRMNRSGDADAPFSYDEITPNLGCVSKASVAQYGRLVFFLSDPGFMMMRDGQEIVPIGTDKVDETFGNSITSEDYERIYSAIDPTNNLMIWGVPGNPGRLWIYNFQRDRFATVSIPFEALFFGLAVPTTLEELAADYTDLDVMPYSLDDERFKGGLKLFLVHERKLVTLTGETLAAHLEFGFGEYLPGQVARFRSIRPVTDAVDGITATLDCRQRLGDSKSARSSGSLRPSGILPIRARGRYARLAINIAAGTQWSYIKGLELELGGGGDR